ncbi:MAG: hypothetical protein ABI696_16360 [Rubrivivax sp.]
MPSTLTPPTTSFARWLARWFARWFARWCGPNAPWRRPLHWPLRWGSIGGRWRLVWTPAPPSAHERAASAARAHAERVALDEGLAALDALLDRQPQARHRLQALAIVARTLHAQGPAALERCRRATLGDALAQFEGLVGDWSPRGLAHLRSVLAVAWRTQASAGDESAHPAPRPGGPPAG